MPPCPCATACCTTAVAVSASCTTAGKRSDILLPVDYLYVCRGYRGTLGDLDRLFDVRYVVFDASFTGYYRRRMEEECLRRGIPVHALDREGALWVPLP